MSVSFKTGFHTNFAGFLVENATMAARSIGAEADVAGDQDLAPELVLDHLGCDQGWIVICRPGTSNVILKSKLLL